VVLRLALILILLAGIAWNMRTAIADQLASGNQPAALRLAMRLDPANATYPAHLAWELQVADPTAAEFLFRRALRLNPYDSSSWINLGLLEEVQGDKVGAEDNLLHAARVDLTWMPAWSLANFYFRCQRWDAFWSWAQKAAQMASDDITPLLRLAWYLAPNETEIQDRLRMWRPEMQRQFLWFLMVQGDPAAIAGWGNHALTTGAMLPGEDLMAASEWLIEHKRPDLALPLWNGLAARHQIPFPPLNPGSGDAVTNGNFVRQPLSRGFDWRMTHPDGVSNSSDTDPPGLGLEFSGRESDSFLLLSEIVPVQPEEPYTLSIESTSSDVVPGSGLELAAADAASGLILARTPGFAAGSQPSEVCFTTPQGVRFLTLMVGYQQQPGTVRIEGHLTIRKVSLVLGTTACALLSAPPRN